ncbi:MAG: M48 family metallopeptidase [Nannocystaceae bacterium]|nr:M48 family metallopeptidase [Nannocystaceae bacterium]
MHHLDPKKRRLAIIGTVLAVCLAAFFLAIPLMSGLLAKLVPQSIADKVGKQVIESLAGNAEFCTDPEGTKALDGLVDKLAAAADHDVPFRVYVVKDDVLNAFAAPGGHVVIYEEIIENAADPQELAGVLAHEMSHELHDHPTKGLVKTVGYGVFSLLVPGSGELGGQIGQAVIESKYSRDDELEADRGGVELLNAAKIDSHGLARFFDTMHDKGSDVPGALEFLSSHPTGDHRQGAVKDLERDGDEAMTAAQWQALRNVCKSHSKTPTPVG